MVVADEPSHPARIRSSLGLHRVIRERGRGALSGRVEGSVPQDKRKIAVPIVPSSCHVPCVSGGRKELERVRSLPVPGSSLDTGKKLRNTVLPHCNGRFGFSSLGWSSRTSMLRSASHSSSSLNGSSSSRLQSVDNASAHSSLPFCSFAYSSSTIASGRPSLYSPATLSFTRERQFTDG